MRYCNDSVIKNKPKNVFALLYVKANSQEICEEIFYPSVFRKMLMSAFLLSFKANYLEKIRGYPNFSNCGFH